MNIDKVITCLNAATEAHTAIGGAVSLETLFLAAYLSPPDENEKRVYRMQEGESVPSEFAGMVSQMAGRHATAASLFSTCYGRIPTNFEAKLTGSWLRKLGKKPRKSNGANVFDL